jgi:hypothetical protein
MDFEDGEGTMNQEMKTALDTDAPLEHPEGMWPADALSFSPVRSICTVCIYGIITMTLLYC